MKSYYDTYYKKMYTVGNQIQLKRVKETDRKGFSKVIDKMVFYKNAFQNGQSWAALPSSLLQWIALTPIAISNVNELLKFVGFPWYVPLSWGSTMAMGLIASLMLFGVYSWTRSGIIRRGSELSTLQDSGRYLAFCEMQDIKEMIKSLEIKLEEKNETS